MWLQRQDVFIPTPLFSEAKKVYTHQISGLTFASQVFSLIKIIDIVVTQYRYETLTLTRSNGILTIGFVYDICILRSAVPLPKNNDVVTMCTYGD